MMATDQSGIIACHSISTTRPEATPRKSVPFKAWPGIKEWERYYLLPTIRVIYRPELLLDPTDASLSHWAQDLTLEQLIEIILNSSPDFEQFASQFMPVFEEHDLMLVEYYQSHFGISLSNQVLPQALANVLNARRERDTFSALDDKNTLSLFIETTTKLLSLEDTFSLIHEASHLYSFSLLRPAITLFNTTWSAIENFLQQAATEEHTGFWDKFIDLNGSITQFLQLEDQVPPLW
jgi:hypothetical protein